MNAHHQSIRIERDSLRVVPADGCAKAADIAHRALASGRTIAEILAESDGAPHE